MNMYLLETFSDEQRVKSTVVKAEKVNPVSKSRYLLGLIDKLSVESCNGLPRLSVPTARYMRSISNNFSTSGIADRYRVEPANQAGLQANIGYGGVMNHNVGSHASCNSYGSAGHALQNCPRSLNRQGHTPYATAYGTPSFSPMPLISLACGEKTPFRIRKGVGAVVGELGIDIEWSRACSAMAKHLDVGSNQGQPAMGAGETVREGSDSKPDQDLRQ
ncbi:uncharacterized protein A4U43_C04F13450 [Asparagus officinalis]|uniref:Uncharacterized protein n=1 Tax=Asparagus officinalis TaxID=4686 RepID=A0A5P1F130_ASPOF|nr:uncharacterized protein A4U43_C04F13450 [Asparagus officinalis]